MLFRSPVEKKVPFESVAEIQRCTREAEVALGQNGRVLLRYSGTELKARIMVEGQDEGLVDKLTQEMAQVVQEHLC